MLKLKKMGSFLIAAVMLVTMCAISPVMVSAEGETAANVVVDADNTTLGLTGTTNKNKISYNTTTVYPGSTKSIAWFNTAAGGAAESVSLETIGLAEPSDKTSLTFRLYSDGADIINLMVYYTNTEGTTGKYVRQPYTFSADADNIGKWVDVTLDLTCIDTKNVNVTTDASKLEFVKLNRGSWSTASTYENNVYIDKIWFGEEVIDTEPPVVEPEEPVEPDEPGDEEVDEETALTLIDFTDTTVEMLPMTNPDANAGGRIDKCDYITYGPAEQSGIWAVTGTKSSLEQYLISDSKLDLAKVAECNSFVIRFHSELDNDVFNVVFNFHDDVKADGYFRKLITVTKAGWQEVVIPVSEIAAELKDGNIANLYSFCLNKGGWSTTDLFNKENDLCFDKMWFEKRTNNVVVDADDASLTLKGSNSSNNVSTTTTKVYSDSSSSIQWYNTKAGGSANSVDLSTIDLSDPTAYTKLTFRMYSDGADIINLMVYFTNQSGIAGKYVREPYTFSEEAGNIGKWVEVTLDLTCMDTKDVNLTTEASKLETVRLNRGSWSTASTYNNNVYIDKIWFGDVEDVNATFDYKTSAYKDATNVGVYDTITLEFEDYLSETIACDAVTVKRDGNKVTEFDAWSDRNFLCIKTDTAMAFDSTYEITVTPALKDQRDYALLGTHTISFKTASPYLAIDDVKIVNSNGDELKALPASGTSVAASAEIVNGSAKDENYVAVLVMYDSKGKMVGIKVSEPTPFVANMTVPHTVAAQGTVPADTATIKGFLWDGLGTLVPCGAAAEIK